MNMRIGARKRLRKFFNSEITDEMIWEEIVNENKLNNIHQLKSLNRDATQRLVQLERRMELLSLGIFHLPEDVAEELAKYKGEILLLNCIKELTEDAAKAIAEFKGIKLGFAGLRTLSLKALRALIPYKGVLMLDSVESIAISPKNEEGANKIFNHLKAQRLSLNSIKKPQTVLLKALSLTKAELELNGINELSLDEAKILVKHPGKELKLKGLTKINEELVKLFGQYKGRLDISGIKKVDDDVIRLFASLPDERFLLHGSINKQVQQFQSQLALEERKKREEQRRKEQEEKRKIKEAEKEKADKDRAILEEFEEFDIKVPEQAEAEPEPESETELPPEQKTTEALLEDEDKKTEAELNFQITAKKNRVRTIMRKGIDNLSDDEKREVGMLRQEIEVLKDKIKEFLDLIVEEREVGAVVFNSSDDLAKYLKESGAEDDEDNALDRIDDMDFFGNFSDNGDADILNDDDQLPEYQDPDLFGDAAESGQITELDLAEGDSFAFRPVDSPIKVETSTVADPFAARFDADGGEQLVKAAKKEKIETAKRMLNDNVPLDAVVKYTGLDKNEVIKLKGVNREKINTAKRMLDDNLPDNAIARYTGLSLEEIEKIKNGDY